MLSVLGLEYNGILGEGLKPLVDKAERLHNLERIYLNNNDITRANTKHLSDFIVKAPSLKSVQLSNNKLSDEGAALIGDAIRGSSSILQLQLVQNGISSDGAKSIAASLRDAMMSTLLDLDLSSNLITMESIQELMTAMKGSNLEVLNIRNNVFTGEEMTALEGQLTLVAALPRKKFLY